MIMVKPKQYQKNLCFLGCLLSPPLYSYIFHQVSTKRGRSIFYHKSLWTQSHVYAGQHTCAHTQSNSIVSVLSWSVTSPGSALVPLGEKEATVKARRPSIVSPRRGRLMKKAECFFYQRDGNTKDTFCRSTLRHLFSYYLVYFPIISENLMFNSSIIGRC